MSFLQTLGYKAENQANKVTDLSTNDNVHYPTTAAVQTAINNYVSGLLEFKGSQDCSADPDYPAASKGDAYYVSAAGKIGGAGGVSVEIGDVFIASADNAGGSQASVGASWFVLEHNLVGAEVTSNKDTDGTMAANSDVKYPSQKAAKTYIDNASSNASVIGKLLTGFSAGAGTVSASDTILQAFNKVVGNIGNKQDADADLTAIAGLIPVDNDIIQRKSGAWTNRTPTQFAADINLVPPSNTITLVAASPYTLTVPASMTVAGRNVTNTFTGAQTINVNSAAALLVEQDGVKDNVLIVDTTNGRVGINGNGANTLNIYDEGKACLAGMYTFTDVSATRSVIIGIKARGTLASPSNIGTNDALFSFVGQGYFEGSNRAAVSIDFDAEGTWATDSYPSVIKFWTNNSTISRTERMRLNAAGNLLIGTTSSVSSGGRLQVVGGVDVKQVVIRAHSTQTANLTDWQNSSGTVQLAIAGNGRDFILDATTGSKIGTATSQKLGFWNAAPIVQPTTGVTAATIVGGAGTTVKEDHTFDGYTIAQVVKALRNTGLLA